MRKRFLLYLTKDQRQPFDYSANYRQVMTDIGGNSGNNVFQYSLQTILRDNDISIATDLWHFGPNSDKEIAELREKYDAVIITPANIIASYAAKDGALQQKTSFIRRLKIPVYVVGVGAQSDYNYSFDFLSSLRKEAIDFIGAVLDGGGRIGVRGYFSQEAICKLGFSSQDSEVIGCPSIFINGDSLQIEKTVSSAQELIPSFNGTPVWNHPQIKKYFDTYPQSVFVDQDKFYRLLFLPQELERKELKYLADKEGKWLHMYLQNRIKFYGDYASWVEDIKNNKINFSFGSRIHGNILPLLQGIPAYITATDSRVRELAEYFHIPSEKLPQNLPELYDFYEKADYGAFNRNFASKYGNFVSFMQKCGLNVSAKTEELSQKVEIPQPKNKELIVSQAKFCSRSRLHYIIFILYKKIRGRLQRWLRV